SLFGCRVGFTLGVPNRPILGHPPDGIAVSPSLAGCARRNRHTTADCAPAQPLMCNFTANGSIGERVEEMPGGSTRSPWPRPVRQAASDYSLGCSRCAA